MQFVDTQVAGDRDHGRRRHAVGEYRMHHRSSAGRETAHRDPSRIDPQLLRRRVHPAQRGRAVGGRRLDAVCHHPGRGRWQAHDPAHDIQPRSRHALAVHQYRRVTGRRVFGNQPVVDRQADVAACGEAATVLGDGGVLRSVLAHRVVLAGTAVERAAEGEHDRRAIAPGLGGTVDVGTQRTLVRMAARDPDHAAAVLHAALHEHAIAHATSRWLPTPAPIRSQSPAGPGGDPCARIVARRECRVNAAARPRLRPSAFGTIASSRSPSRRGLR
jgi:hypothetical protein